MHNERVNLHATAEGRIVLQAGTQAMGQGLQTPFSQMIAEALGVSIDKVDVVQGNTDLAIGFGSVGSRSLFVGGTAAVVSAADLIAKAREKASQMLEASVEDIEYRDGTLTVVGTDKHVSLFDIAKKEAGARLSVDSEGQTDGPSWPNGTHICEVEIDPGDRRDARGALHHRGRCRCRHQPDAGDGPGAWRCCARHRPGAL